MPQNGFTLLEMILVLLLLSLIALTTLATLPPATTRPQAEKLQEMILMASRQPQLDGGVLRLQLDRHQARLSRLAPGRSGAETPFPGHHWQPLNHRLAQFTLPEGMSLSLRVRGRPQPLPATLLFLPDGSQLDLTLSVISSGLRSSEIIACGDELRLTESSS